MGGALQVLPHGFCSGRASKDSQCRAVGLLDTLAESANRDRSSLYG